MVHCLPCEPKMVEECPTRYHVRISGCGPPSSEVRRAKWAIDALDADDALLPGIVQLNVSGFSKQSVREAIHEQGSSAFSDGHSWTVADDRMSMELLELGHDSKSTSRHLSPKVKSVLSQSAVSTYSVSSRWAPLTRRHLSKVTLSPRWPRWAQCRLRQGPTSP